MATFQKRGSAWRAIVRRKGKSLTATFDTKAQAEEWATKIEAQLIEGAEPKVAAETVKVEGETLAALFTRYAEEVSPRKKGTRWEQIRLQMLAKRFPLFKRPAASITGPDMAEWRDQRLKEVSPSSVNRELNLISAVFKQAIREWRIGLTINPVHLISRPKNPKSRTQRVSASDRRRITEQLGWDGESEPQTSEQWAAFAFCLALETAMRKGEILSLTWSDIHFDERYAHLSDTKNGDDRDVPLSSAAIALLRLVKHRPPQAPVVPLTSGNLDKLFRQARRAVGLMHIHFHDSRREAATTMAPKLSNVLELSAITGHRSLKTLMIYYRPKPGDLAAKLD